MAHSPSSIIKKAPSLIDPVWWLYQKTIESYQQGKTKEAREFDFVRSEIEKHHIRALRRHKIIENATNMIITELQYAPLLLQKLGPFSFRKKGYSDQDVEKLQSQARDHFLKKSTDDFHADPLFILTLVLSYEKMSKNDKDIGIKVLEKVRSSLLKKSLKIYRSSTLAILRIAHREKYDSIPLLLEYEYELY